MAVSHRPARPLAGLLTDSHRTRRALSEPGFLLTALVALGAGVVGWRMWGWPALPFLAAGMWLVPLAVYDLRHKAVPHLAWVMGPCGIGLAYTVWRGDWPLAAIGVVALLTSERYRLPQTTWRKPLFWWGLLATLGLLTFTNPEALPGALALIGFWLCFEAGWWAGADALVAMTLALVWPDVLLLVAMSVAHLGVSLWWRRPLRIPSRLAPHELEAQGEPGLPALALTVAVYTLLRLGDWKIG